MEEVHVVAGPTPSAAPGRVVSPDLPFTTPAALRLALIILTLAVVALGAVTMRASLGRSDAADTVGLEATPLLIGAEDLYVALAAADAAASSAYLRAGLEPAELRDEYGEDIAVAGQELAGIAGQTDLAPSTRDAISTIAQELPVYTGLVEAARVNNRLGFPVGAAYLRRASVAMRDRLLPAATTVYADAARQLDRGQRAGTSVGAVVTVVLAAAAVLVLLVGTQLFLVRRTRRLVNLGLFAATLVVVALGGTAVAVFAAQGDALASSQRAGSDPLVTLSTVRILALRARSEENLDLIERGTVEAHMEAFDAATDSIAMLLATADQAADAAGRRRIETIADHYDTFLATHAEVRQLAQEDAYDDADGVAVTDQADAALILDGALAAEIGFARRRLDADAERARDLLGWLPIAVVTLAVSAAVLATVGLRVRLREYR